MQPSPELLNPTQADFQRAIEAVRERYTQEGHTLWDIGNGLCEDFVDDVLTEVVGEGWQMNEGGEGTTWWEVYTDGLYDTETEGRWDWSLLTRIYGINIPEGDRDRYDAIATMGANHVWIFHVGRHYDCEHPEGVSSFFDLNFFRRYLDLAEKLHAA